MHRIKAGVYDQEEGEIDSVYEARVREDWLALCPSQPSPSYPLSSSLCDDHEEHSLAWFAAQMREVKAGVHDDELLKHKIKGGVYDQIEGEINSVYQARVMDDWLLLFSPVVEHSFAWLTEKIQQVKAAADDDSETADDDNQDSIGDDESNGEDTEDATAAPSPAIKKRQPKCHHVHCAQPFPKKKRCAYYYVSSWDEDDDPDEDVPRLRLPSGKP